MLSQKSPSVAPGGRPEALLEDSWAVLKAEGARRAGRNKNEREMDVPRFLDLRENARLRRGLHPKRNGCPGLTQVSQR
eukprot:3460078-Pyramimonas_sp.AAC.1